MLLFILSVFALFNVAWVESQWSSQWTSCMLIRNPLKRMECRLAELKKASTQCTTKMCGECACYTDCKHLKPMRDCLAFKDSGYNESGLYMINMNIGIDAEVFCDMKTDGGGWTVIQRRLNGKLEFNREWKDYKTGFGSDKQQEYWLGNDNIYLLSHQAEYPTGSELRIDLKDWNDKNVYATYDIFSMENEYQKYRLLVDEYSGTAGDSMKLHNGMMFTTKDQSNNGGKTNCAVTMGNGGGWWYSAPATCRWANLNGGYKKTGGPAVDTKGVVWHKYKNEDYSWKYTEMKVRRKK